MSTERGYTHLLNHLHRPTTTLPFPTLQASISHYLANTAPSPTPLSATLVSSPLFYPFSHQKLTLLTTAFRHASHLKYRSLINEDKDASAFALLARRSLTTRLDQWAIAVTKGMQGGQPITRLACCGGLLLGLEDLKQQVKMNLPPRNGRGKIEDEVVVAVAEIMDTYAYIQSPGIWENEFQPATEPGEVDVLSLALILASHALPLVPSDKLKTLPLNVLARLLTSAVDATFLSGAFLSSLSSSFIPSGGYKISLLESSSSSSSFKSLPETVLSMTSSPLTSSIASISKLCARTLSLFMECQPNDGMTTLADAYKALESLSDKIESDWAKSQLSSVTDDNDIAPDSRELTKSIWTTLKTLLFSTIMIADMTLSTLVFVPLPSDSASVSTAVSPSSLALQTLNTLSHLSFVISQFGGVTTTSVEGPGFKELKKTFYLALDILASDPVASDRFVKELCQSFGQGQGEEQELKPRYTLMDLAKKAYALASIEQLIPVLSGECIGMYAFPLCLPHLFDAEHRETFESAHSVVLSLFASHAQHAGEGKTFSSQTTSPLLDRGSANQGVLYTGEDKDKGKTEKDNLPGHAEFNVARIVPYYTHCLIENSLDGKLSSAQLRLAYSALVRSASASASDSTSIGSPELIDERYTLAWFCIQSLLDAIHSLSYSSPSASSTRRPDEDRLHRLHLMLIATVPSLPLALLARVLTEIRAIIIAHTPIQGQVAPLGAAGAEGRRKELVEALFREILESVGDREKEFVLRWWYDNQEKLGSSLGEAQARIVRENSDLQSGILSRL